VAITACNATADLPTPHGPYNSICWRCVLYYTSRGERGKETRKTCFSTKQMHMHERKNARTNARTQERKIGCTHARTHAPAVLGRDQRVNLWQLQRRLHLRLLCGVVSRCGQTRRRPSQTGTTNPTRSSRCSSGVQGVNNTGALHGYDNQNVRFELINFKKSTKSQAGSSHPLT